MYLSASRLPAMGVAPASCPPCPGPLSPGEDNNALDDLEKLFGNDLPLPERMLPNPQQTDASTAWSGGTMHLQPSPFQLMPDPAVLQELSADATATAIRGGLPLGELQPARTSDLTLSTGRQVAKSRNGTSKAAKAGKGFRRLSSEVCKWAAALGNTPSILHRAAAFLGAGQPSSSTPLATCFLLPLPRLAS